MVAPHQIQDQSTLEAWLRSQPFEVAPVIAVRAALRVAPFYWEATSKRGTTTDPQEVLLCRALLIAAVRASGSTADLVTASSSAENVVNIVRRADALPAAAGRANDAARLAIRSVMVGGENASAAVAAAEEAARAEARRNVPEDHRDDPFHSEYETARMDCWEAVQLDCGIAESGADAFREPLWPDGLPRNPPPSPLRRWREQGGAWAFWADWYEGYLNGRPLDLGLLEKGALIPQEEWEKGETHINAIIERIYSGYQIAQSAAELEADFVATVAGAGHNNPPDPIGDLPLIVPEVQEPLRAIREEAVAISPNKERFRWAISALKSLLGKVGSYAAKKADRVIDKSIDTLTPMVWKTLGIWATAHQLGLTQLLDQATAWLAKH